MLVLTRKCEEKIRIGNSITITVFRIKGKAVRLGIEAPSDVTVLRYELLLTNETEPSKVELIRLPRDKVPGIMPKLVSGTLPLSAR